MKVFYTVALIIAFVYLFSAVRLVAKRFIAVRRLKKLDGYLGAKIKFTRNPILTLFKMSHAPDLTAEIGDKIYLMRFYNGRGKRSQAHFANEEYSVVFSVLLIRSLFAVGGRFLQGHSRNASSTTSMRRKVRIVPKLECPKEYERAEEYGKKLIPILIFNPSPSEVSYVTDEKTSIRLAFTGDEFRGIKIFTGSSVASFLEREARAAKNEEVFY